MAKTGLILACFMLLACGGDDDGGGDGSGVDGSKAITDLSGGEVTSFCSWSIDVQGGAGHTTDCGEGFTVTTSTQAECEAMYAQLPDGCSGVTVSELEACVESMGEDPCAAFEADVCADFIECSLGG